MSRRFLLNVLAAWLLATPGSVLAATAPAQPKTGPGGLGNAEAEVVKRGLGQASAGTYAYYLAEAASEPRPVVVLLHAWGAVNPVIYGGWIDHLARHGYLVLYPAFQEIGKTRPVEATDKAASLVKQALASLADDPQARPDLSRLAYLGHSAGSAIGLNLAAEAQARDLPVPRLVYASMPGGIASNEKSRGIQLADLSSIDSATVVVTMVGDREFQAADRASRRILRETSAVPVTRKLFMRAASDDHGFPTLSATLSSPASPKEGFGSDAIKLPPDPPVERNAPRAPRPRWSADMVLSGEQTVLVAQLQRNVTDTLDWLAYWRTFDLIAASAFSGGDMATLKADASFADMGRWTDGWPVRRLAAEIPKAVDPAAQPVARVAPPAIKPAAARKRQTRRSR